MSAYAHFVATFARRWVDVDPAHALARRGYVGLRSRRDVRAFAEFAMHSMMRSDVPALKASDAESYVDDRP